MKLTQLSKKPELVKVELTDDETIKEYGEPLEFWIYDRTGMDVFVKMATMKNEDFGDMVDIVNKMILDEEGNRAVKEGEALPNDVMLSVIGAVVERLGK